MKTNVFTPSTESLVQKTNINRILQPGIAVDSPGTSRPEDVIYASAETDGSFQFAASIIEVGILDRGGKSVRKLIGQLATKASHPSLDMPPDRGIFFFYEHRQMPALTLVGNFRADKGLSGLDIIRTKITPGRYSYASKELTQNDNYYDASRFVHAFQKYYRGKANPNPKRVFMKPSKTIETFANLVNTCTASLTRTAGLPQLLHAYPATIVLGNGQEIVAAEVTTEQHGHELLSAAEYTGVTNPIRDERSWINQVAISHFMETGESIMDYDEATLIANWLNKRRKMRIERKHMEKIAAQAA